VSFFERFRFPFTAEILIFLTVESNGAFGRKSRVKQMIRRALADKSIALPQVKKHIKTAILVNDSFEARKID